MRPKYQQTNIIPTEVYYDARDNLSQEDAHYIDRNVSILMSMRNFGEGSATELLAKLGIFLLGHTDQRSMRLMKKAAEQIRGER